MSAGKVTDGIKTQLNFKTSAGTLVNVYLYSYDEAEIKQALESIANVTPEIQAVETLYNAQGVLRDALGATPVEQSAVKSAPASSGSKACKHGEMTFRNGTSAKGPWKGYFCPSPKGTPDQCEPQFIR
jgi:hypothetical protein